MTLGTSSATDFQQTEAAPARRALKPWQRALVFFVAWLIVLLPFLFWRGTWFGRPLRDAEVSEYLRDNSKPRHIQHALVQIGERMARSRERGAQPSAGVA